MSIRKPSKGGLAAQRLHAVLPAIIGTTKLGVISLAIIYIVLFELFINAGNGLFNTLFSDKPVNGWHFLVGVIPFLLATYLIVLAARSKRPAFRAKVITRFWKPGGEQRSEYVSPKKVKGMIVFLSHKGSSHCCQRKPYAPIIQEMIAGKTEIGLKKGTYQVSIEKSPWRLILDAVNYHLPSLQYLIIIPSKGDDGTHKVSADLMALVKEAVKPHKIEVKSLDSFRCGVDYEDVDELISAVEDAHLYLENQEKLMPNEILIDITGGQKVPTIAGAIVALGEGRRFQYISTNDYSIKTYDAQYESL